ncbi:MAG: IPT/TIG domain-containing protein [Planctomycetota bacterium]
MTGAFAACLLFSLAGCGGGGDATDITVSLQSVTPSTSNDLNGGDVVEIRGRGFMGVTVARVMFVGASTNIGFDLEVVDDGLLRVRTPPAPSGSPGPVTVEVEYRYDDEDRIAGLFAGYTYIAPGLPPDAQTISPTSYSPTGAASFTIQGTNLGTPGGTVDVRFAGIGRVRANVNDNATIVTGRAPVALNAPASGPVDVFVEPDGGTAAKVQTAVQFDWAQPTTLAVANQAAGVSRPVRLDDRHALMATAGNNGTWGDGDDDLVIITGPDSPSAIPVRMPGFVPAGYLDATNSIPAVLDANSACLYSVGPDGTAGTNDDYILYATNLQAAAPVFTPIVFATLNSAPLVAISSTRVVTTLTGPDLKAGTNDDEILVLTLGGGVTPAVVAGAGPMDASGGRGSWSLPMSPDGNLIYVMSMGPDATPGTADDVLWSLRAAALPSSGFINTNAPYLLRPPVWVGNNTLAAPAGNNGAPGGPNDRVMVFNDGATLTRTILDLDTRVNTGSLRAFATFGNGLFAVSTAGPDQALNSGDERVRVYTDISTGAFTELALPGIAQFAPLPNGGLGVFTTGPNYMPGDGDDAANLLDSTATVSNPFGPPSIWTAAFNPLGDNDRLFLVSAGVDNTVGTGDEGLVVHQSLAIGENVSTAQLPLAVAATEPLTGAEPYVPVGPGWGVIQSPGSDGIYGTGDDQIIAARH